MLLQQSLNVLNVAGNGLDSLADLLPLQELTHLNASDNLLADMKVREGSNSIAPTVAKQSIFNHIPFICQPHTHTHRNLATLLGSGPGYGSWS